MRYPPWVRSPGDLGAGFSLPIHVMLKSRAALGAGILEFSERCFFCLLACLLDQPADRCTCEEAEDYTPEAPDFLIYGVAKPVTKVTAHEPESKVRLGTQLALSLS